MAKGVNLLQLTPQEFISFLKNENISRFYFIYDAKNKIVRSSHEQLHPIAQFIQSDKRDFMMLMFKRQTSMQSII